MAPSLAGLRRSVAQRFAAALPVRAWRPQPRRICLPLSFGALRVRRADAPLHAAQRDATPALVSRSVAAGVAFGTFPVPVLAPLVLVPLFAKAARLSLPLVVAVQVVVGAGAPRPRAAPMPAADRAARRIQHSHADRRCSQPLTPHRCTAVALPITVLMAQAGAWVRPPSPISRAQNTAS